MNGLELCPFCGGEAKEFTGEDAAPHRWTVECESCGAHVGSDTRHKARTKWNLRAERTCQDVEGGNFFRCSKCGCEIMRVADGWKPLYMGEVNYCPNCGAKVVHAEGQSEKIIN